MKTITDLLRKGLQNLFIRTMNTAGAFVILNDITKNL